MDQFNVFGIGEFLWDELPQGRRPGGAPANFAYVATQLGNAGAILSRVGDDEKGRELVASIAAGGVDTRFVQTDKEFPTGTVSVTLNAGQPEYVIHEQVAWGRLEFTEEWSKAAEIADAVSFGTLGQRSSRSREAIRSFLHATNGECLRLLDLNLRQSFYSAELITESLETANALKLNDSELEVICNAFGIGGELPEALGEIREGYGLRFVCLTRGSEPTLLVTESKTSEAAVELIEVVDAVGAGDAFSGGLVHGFLRGWDPYKINLFAGRVGSYVASREGAMPDFSDFDSGVAAADL